MNIRFKNGKETKLKKDANYSIFFLTESIEDELDNFDYLVREERYQDNKDAFHRYLLSYIFWNSLKGLTWEELGAIVGKSPAMTKMMWHRAIRIIQAGKGIEEFCLAYPLCDDYLTRKCAICLINKKEGGEDYK